MKIRTLSILAFICVFISYTVQSSIGGGQKHQGLKKLGVDDKIEKLLRKMTLEEKIGQMTQYSWRSNSKDYHDYLKKLVRQGKVRYIGTSTFNAWRLVEAQWAARTYSLERYCSEQLNYSIINRFVEKDILRVCDRYGIGVTVWSPLNWGWLSGKYRRGKDVPEGSRAARGMRIKLDTPEGRKNLDIVEKLAPLAEQRDLTLSQFSLAWLLKNPVVTSVICGPRLLSHFEDNVAADDAELDDEAMVAVDKICPPTSGDGSEWW